MTRNASADLAITPLRQQASRMPSLVADGLRRQILSGDLPDGHRLPKEEDLRQAFGVGRPVMREAMRILESEGLVTIARGNQGGAIVRLPQPSHTSYAIGLILAAKGVGTGDVRAAIRELEPACAALCAERADREEAVVAKLRALHEHSLEILDDSDAVTIVFRQFHEVIADNCGNETLRVVVGALEQLWSSHVQTSVRRAKQKRPLASLQRSCAEHARIMDRIAAGDAQGARDAVLGHIDAVQHGVSSTSQDSLIDVGTLRAGLSL